MPWASRPIADRLWEKFYRDVKGCWIWTGKKGRGGYGVVWLDGKSRYAHRVSYELCVGKIPDGLQIDHLCRTRCCINPAHLEPVTAKENLQRAYSLITHCKEGHPLSGENLLLWKGNGRRCRICTRSRKRNA